SGFRFSPNPNRAAEIKWKQWGKEAFEEARSSKKPVLLSLSAVWCHWCHVMDETTYSDLRIIEFINRYFVAIRVDSDMRPDIDAIYNQGGWPSTVFLSPEGVILDGGTYIPPDEMLLRLKRVLERYRNGNYRNAQTKEENTKEEPPVSAVSIGLINSIKEMLLRYHDRRYGGFGGYQKFPNPSAIDFLLDYSVTVGKDKELDSAVKITLDGMANGEIHDKIEGGFFRYSTRRDWSAPHYEKMLETNGNMLSNYARAYRRYGDKKYLKMLDDIVRYVKNNLTGENGEFYGSQDADEAYYKSSNRDKSNKPAVDKTVYTDRASVMVMGLLDAYNATLDEKYLSLARRGIGFLKDKLYHPEVGVYHYYRGGKVHVSGLLRDNALFGLASISFYNVTGKREYLELAQELETIIYRDYLKDGKLLITLKKPVLSQWLKGPYYHYNERMIWYETLYFLKK
ncbi:MAG: thioredoxin domain-containing protein, partial [Nitrospirae bacterium]